MEELIVWFKEISKRDIEIVGGKGANLGEMSSLDLPIPNGFCTTSFAFRDALKQTGVDVKVYELLKGLDVEDTQRLQEISAQIQTIISNITMPDYIEKAIREAYEKMKKPSLSVFATDDVYPWVAVRSSATAEDLPSISENEHILIKINGNPIYKRMKDVYSLVGDGKTATLEIPAMVGNNVKWKNASEIYKHWVSGDKLYKIKTKTGKEVTISPNHTLIILDEKTLMPKITQISELKGGEKIPACAKNLDEIFEDKKINTLNEDILWDTIKEIKPVKYEGWVYDFTVPKVENFVSGIGGIITHNSASFAGQQATYLNIRGPDKVIDTVKKCWASLFTARAIYYREKQGFSHDKVALAAVIQVMIDSKKAGVMFTAMPTGDTSKMVIEAAYGLGEAVVSGSLTPDTYIIKKGTNEILDKRIEAQKWKITRGPHGDTMKVDVKVTETKEQKISDKEIKALANYGKQLEEHYGHPQDIEWAVDKKGNIFILQTRAITTLKPIKKEGKTETKEIIQKPTNGKVLVEGLSASPGIAKGPVKLVHDIANLGKVVKGDILVTGMTTPDFVPAMRKAAAIVTDAGGITAHAAIVSRELGIPCIVGSGNATQILKDGMIIVVDANEGKVYPETHAIEIKAEKIEEIAVQKQPFITTTKVKVNVALPEAVDRAAAANPDGIGLLRAEHMLTSEAKHPAYYLENNKLDELKDVLKKYLKEFSQKLNGKPIWYRTLDVRTDEFTELKGAEKEPKEPNPMLGWHGIRRSLDQPEIILTEFKAIKELQAEGFKNIGVMIPFTQHVEEYKKAKELAIQAGINMNEIEFGVMIETPGSALTIKDYINEGIDFISFGTNDLTQLTLGLDRNNEAVQKHWTELHPAVLYQIEHVIKACKKANVQTSICGQAGSNPEMVRKLIKMGITSVSANIDAVQKIKQIVAEEERKIILKAAIKKISDIR